MTTLASLASNRARGHLRIGFVAEGGITRLADLSEAGGIRAKFPDVGRAEAVVINTAGGMAGGDRACFEFTVGAGARATITTVAAEKIHRAGGEDTRLDTELRLASGAVLAWLPQETILFDGARLSRSLNVDMAADAELLLAEIVVFGRAAMGERLTRGALSDRWRVRRDGRLVFAENVSLDGPMADLLARPAIGAGARAVAALLHVGPEATARLDALRAVLEGAGSECGASAWNGLLVARFVGQDAATLRLDVSRALEALSGQPLPRVWAC